MMTTSALTRRIGQSHLAPGMSLQKQQEIFYRHNVTDWDSVSRLIIDQIANEIAAIVNAAKEQS